MLAALEPPQAPHTGSESFPPIRHDRPQRTTISEYNDHVYSMLEGKLRGTTACIDLTDDDDTRPVTTDSARVGAATSEASYHMRTPGGGPENSIDLEPIKWHQPPVVVPRPAREAAESKRMARVEHSIRNTPMSNTPLPADVLLLIFDALNERKPHPTLRACALTCRAMCPLAQARLFRHIELDDEVEYFAAFTRTIDQSPHLAPLVKTLTISIPFMDDWPDEEEIPDCPLPLHVVERLTGLRSAYFEGMPEGGPDTDEPLMMLSFFKLFGSLATLTNVTFYYVTFRDLAELADLVWSFPSITFLALVMCHVPPNHATEAHGDPRAVPHSLLCSGRCRRLRALGVSFLRVQVH